MRCRPRRSAALPIPLQSRQGRAWTGVPRTRDKQGAAPGRGRMGLCGREPIHRYRREGNGSLRTRDQVPVRAQRLPAGGQEPLGVADGQPPDRRLHHRTQGERERRRVLHALSRRVAEGGRQDEGFGVYARRLVGAAHDHYRERRGGSRRRSRGDRPTGRDAI